MPEERERTFAIEIPEITLTVEEIWPDGDAPDQPTAQDVADRMKQDKPYSRLITEWNLVERIEVFSNYDASRAIV